jgi:hypothetical protein
VGARLPGGCAAAAEGPGPGAYQDILSSKPAGPAFTFSAGGCGRMDRAGRPLRDWMRLPDAVAAPAQEGPRVCRRLCCMLRLHARRRPCRLASPGCGPLLHPRAGATAAAARPTRPLAPATTTPPMRRGSRRHPHSLLDRRCGVPAVSQQAGARAGTAPRGRRLENTTLQTMGPSAAAAAGGSRSARGWLRPAAAAATGRGRGSTTWAGAGGFAADGDEVEWPPWGRGGGCAHLLGKRAGDQTLDACGGVPALAGWPCIHDGGFGSSKPTSAATQTSQKAQGNP